MACIVAGSMTLGVLLVSALSAGALAWPWPGTLPTSDAAISSLVCTSFWAMCWDSTASAVF